MKISDILEEVLINNPANIYMLVVCILRERRQNQEKKIKIYALNLPSKASKFRLYLSFKVISSKSVLRSD